MKIDKGDESDEQKQGQVLQPLLKHGGLFSGRGELIGFHSASALDTRNAGSTAKIWLNLYVGREKTLCLAAGCLKRLGTLLDQA